MSTGGMTCERINGDLIAVAMTPNCGITCCSKSCCCNILADTFGEWIDTSKAKLCYPTSVEEDEALKNVRFFFVLKFHLHLLLHHFSVWVFLLCSSLIVELIVKSRSQSLMLLWNLFLDKVSSRKNSQASAIKINQEKTPRCCLLSRRLTS